MNGLQDQEVPLQQNIKLRDVNFSNQENSNHISAISSKTQINKIAMIVLLFRKSEYTFRQIFIKNYLFKYRDFLSTEESVRFSKYMMRCAIWYHLYNLKNIKNTYGGVLILVKLQALRV